MNEFYREKVNDILKKLNIEVWMRSTNNEPIPDATANLIWYSLLLGLAIPEMESILGKFTSKKCNGDYPCDPDCEACK